MSKNEARGNQRQSEAIRGNQLLVIQRPSETISDAIPGRTSGAMKVQSDAIRRNHTQSDAISTPGALCFRVFRVLGGPQVGLCFVFSCFGRPPSKHSTGARDTPEGATEKLGFLVNSETRHTEGASNQIKSLSLLDSAKGVVLLGLSGGVEFVSVSVLCTPCVRPVYALRRSGVLGVE